MATIDVQLPDGRLIRIEGANSDDEARQAVLNMLSEERRARPIDSPIESGVAGFRGTAGAGVGAGEAAAAAVGAEGVRDFLGGIRESVAGGDANAETRPPELRDLLTSRAPAALAAYAGQGLGSIGGIAIGTLLGAGAGAVAGGAPGAATGATAGTFAAARAAGIGELYRGLVDEGVDPQLAGLIAVPVGYAIGRIETRYLEDFLQRQLAGRVDPGVITRVAQRFVGGRPAGIRASAAAGAISEAGGEALRQGTIAATTGDLNLAERAERVAEEGLVGSFPGMAIGVVNRARGRAGDEPPTGAPPPPDTGAPAGGQPASEPVLPPEPAPFTNADEARQYLDADSRGRPRVDLTDEQLLSEANRRQYSDWQGTTSALRLNEINQFMGGTGQERLRADGSSDYTRVAAATLPRLYDADNAGDISLRDGFTVEQLTELALRRAQVSDPTNNEYRQVRLNLDGLVNEGYLSRSTTRLPSGKKQTTFFIADRNLEPLRQMAFERAQQQAAATVEGPTPVVQQFPADWQAEQSARPTPQVARDPNAPTTVPQVQPTSAELEARRQQATEAFAASDPAPLLQRLAADDTFAMNYLDNFFGTMGRNPSQGSIIASARQQGLILTPEQASAVYARGRQLNILNPLGNYDPPARRAEKAAAKNAAVAKTTLNQVAATGQPATISPQVAGEAVAQVETQQATEDLARAAAAPPPPTARPAVNIPVGGPTQAAGWQAGAQVSPVGARPTRAQPIRGEAPPRDADSFTGEGAFTEPDLDNPPEPAFAAPRQGTPTARTPEQQAEAAESFARVTGGRGRLSFAENLFLRDLDPEVQRAAADAGIEGPIAGYAVGDLAVLSLADSTMPLNQVAIHEGVHVAENMGLIKSNDIALLNASRNDIINAIRRDLDFVADPDSLAPNEVRAYGANARLSRGTDFGPLVNRIFDRLVNLVGRLRNFVQGRGFRTWRDVYDEFLSGRTATLSTPGEATLGYDKPSVDFAAPRPISTPQQGQQATQQYFENQIRGPSRWFSSLDLTIAKDRPALRPAADNMVTGRRSNAEAKLETESLYEEMARLPAASQAKVLDVWQTASMTQKAPVVTNLDAREQSALQAGIAAVQRAFDWLVEAHVIDYFTPSAKMTQAEQARLKAFWARNDGKHLWEIPAAELRAASPQGFAEFQRLNKMRNPYKLPAIAEGTHFVAVYKKNARGEREGKPLRMIAYTPPGFMARMSNRFRRGADPETVARAELQRQFPDANKYYIMQRGQEFTLNSAEAQIRNNADLISQYLSGVAALPAINNSTQAKNLLNTLIDRLDKAQLERVFRSSDNVLQAVSDINRDSYAMDAVPRYLLGVASIQARRRTQSAWTEAIKPLTASDQKWLNDLRDYAYTPTEAFGGLRTFTFFYLLGFAPDTALINALQTLQVTMPMMIRDGGVGSVRHFVRASREALRASDLAARDAFKRGSQAKGVVDYMGQALTDPAEKAAYDKAVKAGTLAPLFTNESRGQVSIAGLRNAGVPNPVAWARRANTVARWAGGMQQYVEQTARAATFLAAYRAAVANPQIVSNKNRIDNLQLQTPYDYATSVVDDTHYAVGREDRALYQRFTPLAEPATQFMSFVTKTIEIYLRQARLALRGVKEGNLEMAKAGSVALLAMTAPVVALAGIWALPGAEFLKEAFEALIKEVWGTTQNFDADMKRAAGGGYWGEVLTRGFPSANGWASLHRRLALDPVPFSDLFGGQVISLFGGPSLAPVEGLIKTYNYAKQGDLWNAAASLAPRAVGNVIKAADLGFGTGSIRSQRGNVLLSPEQVAEIDAQYLVAGSAFRQAIGFPAPEINSLREALVRKEEQARQLQLVTQRFNNEAARYLTEAWRAQQRGDNERASRFFRQFDEVIRERAEANDREFSRNRGDLAVNFNMRAIQQRAYDDLVGRTSEQAGMRGVPQNIRPRVMEERALYDWRALQRQQAQQ